MAGSQRVVVLTTAIAEHTICVSVVFRRRSMMRAVSINLRALLELQDQRLFALDSDKFQQFTAMLDAPVADNPGLARLKEIKAPWVSRNHSEPV